MAPSVQDLKEAVLHLTGDDGTHDPTIVREKGVYYRFATGPGIPIAASADMKNWKSAGQVFGVNPPWTGELIPGSTWFWAPEVVYRQGRWRIYYSVSTFGSPVSAIGLASSPTLNPRDPGYAWRDDGVVITSKVGDDFNAIDAAVASDEFGQDWILWGSFWGGLKLRKLDSLTGKPPLGDQKIYHLAHRRVEPDTIEGGFILARGGWFYLFCSFDFCCRGLNSTYRIAVGRSKTITGPYLDRDGRDLNQGGGTVIRDGEGDQFYAALGHNSIYTEGLDAWMVFHAYSRHRDGASVLAIEKLFWDDEGWPLAPGQLLKTINQSEENYDPRKTSD